MDDALTRSDEPANSDRFTTLGRKFELTGQEAETLSTLFEEALAGTGLEAGKILNSVGAGKGLAEALALPAGTSDLLYARAHQWFNIGRFDKAESLFLALCILYGEIADHWVGYGICQKINGKPQVAELAFETASHLRPDWAIPHFHRLDLTIRQGDFARAAQVLAAFDERANETVPQPILDEVTRFRTALLLREGKDQRDMTS